MPTDLLSPHLLSQIGAFLQVLLVDITLAGDNAIIVGLAVAGLPKQQQRPAIFFGVAAAAVIRAALGAVALELLAIVGVLLAGGLLLLWVCWRMYRELRRPHRPGAAETQPKSLRAAIFQIVLADISMSLDNVLAVAGAANGHLWVLVGGLLISVVLMGAAAQLVARLLERYRWIAWVGLLIVLWIALRLIWDGSWEIVAAVGH